MSELDSEPRLADSWAWLLSTPSHCFSHQLIHLFRSEHMQTSPANKKYFLRLTQHTDTENHFHSCSELQLGYKATLSNTNRSHHGQAIPILCGGQASCGRMERRLSAHRLTQKPRHCNVMTGTSAAWAAPGNSILVKQGTMLLISWLAWLTSSWKSEEAMKTTALSFD